MIPNRGETDHRETRHRGGATLVFRIFYFFF